jgi:peptidoglycan/LPS O-acetylase OafA/YrhL
VTTGYRPSEAPTLRKAAASAAEPENAGAIVRGGRIASLDGLRGIAALTVLGAHAILAGIAYHHYSARNTVTWLGSLAVSVFFVLSGFVLVRPALHRPLRLRSYYRSRAIRLYLPVWAAIAFAASLHLAFDWRHVTGASWWLNAHGEPETLRDAAKDAALFKTAGWAYVESL